MQHTVMGAVSRSFRELRSEGRSFWTLRALTERTTERTLVRMAIELWNWRKRLGGVSSEGRSLAGNPVTWGLCDMVNGNITAVGRSVHPAGPNRGLAARRLGAVCQTSPSNPLGPSV